MISIIVGAILAALFVGLIVVRVRYGALRVSELPALLWCLLAGGDSRRQLQAILSHRDSRRADVAAVSRVNPQVAELHAQMDNLAERATARRANCINCGEPSVARRRCEACYRRWKTNRDLRPYGLELNDSYCQPCDDDRLSNLRWN